MEFHSIYCLFQKVSDTGNQVHLHAKGLSILFAAFFIVGEIAGSGVLALPKAIDDSGTRFTKYNLLYRPRELYYLGESR
jgi:hypothetical protein